MEKIIRILPSGVFLGIVFYLTNEYLKYNQNSLQPWYSLTLTATVLIHFVLFIIYITNEVTGISGKKIFIGTFVVIVTTCLLKASFTTRNIPGKEIVDFTYYFKFKDTWPYLQKFLWHFTLDITVLCMFFFLKNILKHFNIKIN